MRHMSIGGRSTRKRSTRRRSGARPKIVRVVPLTLVALVAVVALVAALVANPPDRSRIAVAAAAGDGTPLRVMPLGDSITEGYDASTGGADGGYRTDLWQLFQADGRAIDFVGSVSRGPSRLGDKDHEGHGGWRIDHIAGGPATACGVMTSGANVTGWVTSAKPDAVLLHIGTNDINGGCAVGTGSAQVAARLSTLIDYIAKAAPAADVYVATITPVANATMNAQVQAYNARIPGIVSGKAAAGKKVHLVDVAAAVPAADLSDPLHPTNGGYSKMAARWYSALTGASLARTEAEAATSTLNKASVVQTINASGQRKVGQINEADSYVQLSVSAPTAGPYRLYVRGANGTGDSCTHKLTVNGGGARDLTYPSHGWDQWSISAAEVWLKAGPNSVRLAKGDCFAEVDSVDVAAGLAMYPRAIRLAHAGEANGRVIASLNTSSTGGLTDMSRFYESADGGTTFQPIGEVRDGEAAGGRGACCGSLFELPAQAGSLPAGTLLWGTTVGMEGRPGRRPAIRVWKSSDRGRTWSYLSSCGVAEGTPRAREGLWEPEFSVAASGALNCYYSDETQYPSSAEKSTQVISAVTSTDGGRIWGPRRDVVDLGAGNRPGMASVRRLPSGGYVMAYELCGSAQQQACKVHHKTSADGVNWGDPGQAGAVARDLNGNVLFHAPTLAVAPSGSPEGRLLMVGGLVKNSSGGILLGQSGKTIFTNSEGGVGNWSPIEAPVQVPFSSAAPGGEEVVCNNYSSALLPSADGARLLEIATRRVGDPNRGRCTAVFDSGSARGAGDATGVSSGKPYLLRNLLSAKCLDAGTGSDPTAAPVQQWACNGLPRQDWKPTSVGGGHYQLVNQRSGKCLDLQTATNTPGVAVQQKACGAADSQRWRIVNVGRGHYNLVAKLSGLCLDVASGSSADGAKVQQWTCNDRSPQVWRLEAR